MLWKQHFKDAWLGLWVGTLGLLLGYIFISHLHFLSGLPIDYEYTWVDQFTQFGIILILFVASIISGAVGVFGTLTFLGVWFWDIPSRLWHEYKQRKEVMNFWADWLEVRYACPKAIKWIKTQRTPQEAWDNCTDPTWLYWLLQIQSIQNPTRYRVDRDTLARQLAVWSDSCGYLNLRGDMVPEMNFWSRDFRNVAKEETVRAIRKQYPKVPYRSII
ncbi:MAG: hypothetical protein HN932_12835 [Candidatus Marinimicrobia bacterium]|jgi:hypothetical protein|nr:hypothetical protein [Candidatus Neomarinimicrobiota bacterium]MBT7339099.1 hypothetical protein [Candidatus Jacksonbacteria bacterium]